MKILDPAAAAAPDVSGLLARGVKAILGPSANLCPWSIVNFTGWPGTI